jgi:hypothetical protein
MPYRLEWFPHLVLFHYTGTVTSEEILQSNLAVYGDSRFDELRWEVAYFEPGTILRTEAVTLKRLAYLDRAASKTNPSVKVLLVGDQGIQEQVYQSYAEHADPNGWEVIAFETLEEAYAHLGFDPRSKD